MIGAEHKNRLHFLKCMLESIITFVDLPFFASDVSECSRNMTKISYEWMKQLQESHEVSKLCDRCRSRPVFDNSFTLVINPCTRCTDLKSGEPGIVCRYISFPSTH